MAQHHAAAATGALVRAPVNGAPRVTPTLDDRDDFRASLGAATPRRGGRGGDAGGPTKRARHGEATPTGDSSGAAPTTTPLLPPLLRARAYFDACCASLERDACVARAAAARERLACLVFVLEDERNVQAVSAERWRGRYIRTGRLSKYCNHGIMTRKSCSFRRVL